MNNQICRACKYLKILDEGDNLNPPEFECIKRVGKVNWINVSLNNDCVEFNCDSIGGYRVYVAGD